MANAMAGLLNLTGSRGPSTESPVLTAGMGQESLAERLARLAREAQDQAQVAATSGQASPGNQPRNSTGGLAEAVAPRRGGGNGGFRGITSGMAPEVPEIQQLEQDITGAARSAAEGTVPGQQGPATDVSSQPLMPPANSRLAGPAPYAAGAGLGSKLRPDAASGMLPPPAPSRAEQRVGLAAAMRGPRPDPMAGVPGMQQPAPAIQPVDTLPAPPPAPEAPAEPVTKPALTARQQAEAEVGPRTKMNKLGIALSAAAETLGGLAGGMNSGATARAMGARGAKIAARTKEIQAEMDRLQADLDKEQGRRRLDEKSRLDTLLAESNIKDTESQIAFRKGQLGIQATEAETKRIEANNKEENRKANLEFKNRKLASDEAKAAMQKVPDGGSLVWVNPATREPVVIYKDEVDPVVTSTSTTDTITVDGKPVTKSSSSVQTKGPSGTVSIPPSDETVKKTRRALLDRAKKDGNLTQVQINYLNATGGLEDK